MTSQKRFRYTGNDPISRSGITGNVVFTNGCFDILHPGHLDVLRSCRRVADGYRGEGIVVVGINSDESIRRIKGPNRPILKEEDRRDVLIALRYVDQVWIFDDDSPYTLIKKIRPDIIVKGGDYDARQVVGFDLAPVMIVARQSDHSTTQILRENRATHRCKTCGALWIMNPPSEVQPDGSWSLASLGCGICCNNVAMGSQIERLVRV